MQENTPEDIALASTFTYQGYLEQGGVPLTATCDIQFSLFDAAASGTQIGTTLTRTNIAVNGGVFNVLLDFGGAAFDGEDRYLAISVRCPAGEGTYTLLTPRQPIMPVPYAMALYGLRTEANAISPNIVGGYTGNSVTTGVTAAVIAGGGEQVGLNRVTDNFGTVSGGQNNRAGNDNGIATDRLYATVGGGLNNIASNLSSTIAGGQDNHARGGYDSIGGGWGNETNIGMATIAGGWQMVR